MRDAISREFSDIASEGLPYDGSGWRWGLGQRGRDLICEELFGRLALLMRTRYGRKANLLNNPD